MGKFIKPVAKTMVTPTPKPVEPAVRDFNVDEQVIGGKLYKKEAFQEDGPHSPTKFRLVEIK